MAVKDDVLDAFEGPIRARPSTNPWQIDASGTLQYVVDYGLLETLLGIPVGETRASESGHLAKAIDAWVAYELRRCGFPPDEISPRLTKPRVVPREVGIFIEGLPKSLQVGAQRALLKNKSVAPSAAKVLGRAYVKQVDVVLAQWARGPELLVSTKSMVSSFKNNLPNRFEESYGDAKNLRGRYPLASMGFLFVLRSTVLDEIGAVERAFDMLRKLKAESDVYDATCAIIVEWSDMKFEGVAIRTDVVPLDLSAEVFLPTLVDAVLARTPVDHHVRVRSMRRGTRVGLPETETAELDAVDEPDE